MPRTYAYSEHKTVIDKRVGTWNQWDKKNVLGIIFQIKKSSSLFIRPILHILNELKEPVKP